MTVRETWNNLARWSALVDDPSVAFEQIDVNDLNKRREHLRRFRCGQSQEDLRPINVSL